MAGTKSNSTDTNAALDFVRGWLPVILGVLAIAGAVLHVFEIGNFDREVLYYLIVSGVLLILPTVKSFKMGQEGISFEMAAQIKADIASVKEQVAVVDEKANLNSKAVTQGLGLKAPVARSTKNLEAAKSALTNYDEVDPQKNQWGGKDINNNRRIRAEVTPTPGNREWFNVTILVESIDPIQTPLDGEVIFHLHPTFRDPNPRVPVRDGEAVLTRLAWGAFTVGAEADEGKTKLELDLSEIKDAPYLFRSR